VDEVTRRLVAVSAAVAARVEDRLRAALLEAHEVSPAAAIEEVLLQSYLFLGYPAALNALGLWRQVSGRAAPPASEGEWDAWRARGEAVCGTVYGGQYGRLRENIRTIHPDMEAWMVVEGYGKVLGRPGLDLVTRELCVVALLAAQDAPAQLYAHLRGALNAGATAGAVAEALAVAAAGLPVERASAAAGVWAEVLRRRDTG
jgi:4-carboxymuconolactone decarboxylase